MKIQRITFLVYKRSAILERRQRKPIVDNINTVDYRPAMQCA